MNTVFDRDVRDWADRPVELQTAIMSTIFGLKLSPANERKLLEFEQYQRNKIRKEIGKETGDLKRDYQRNKITEKEYRERTEALIKLKKKLLLGRPK
jgi:hypothetical protein